MGRFTRFATQPRRVPPPPTKACSTPTNAALQAVGDLFVSPMHINLDRVFSNLNDFEQIEVELEAEERGVHIHVVLAECIRAGLALDMDEVFAGRDRQCKSH
jgi:hypothetical protein